MISGGRPGELCEAGGLIQYSRGYSSTPLPCDCVRIPISGLPESHHMGIGNSNKHCSVVLVVLNIRVFVEK